MEGFRHLPSAEDGKYGSLGAWSLRQNLSRGPIWPGKPDVFKASLRLYNQNLRDRTVAIQRKTLWYVPVGIPKSFPSKVFRALFGRKSIIPVSFKNGSPVPPHAMSDLSYYPKQTFARGPVWPPHQSAHGLPLSQVSLRSKYVNAWIIKWINKSFSFYHYHLWKTSDLVVITW